MDGPDPALRLRGENRKGRTRFVAALVIPDPGHQEWALAGQVDVVGLLPAVGALPFVKSRGGYQAPVVPNRLTEQRLVGRCFRPRIDRLYPGLLVGDEMRDKPPGHVDQFEFLAPSVSQYGDLLTGSDVVPRRKGRLPLRNDRLAQRPVSRIFRQVVSTAHAMPGMSGPLTGGRCGGCHQWAVEGTRQGCPRTRLLCCPLSIPRSNLPGR